MMSGVKLTYFGLRGRGETCRLVLAAAGVKFNDVCVDYLKEWEAFRPSTKFDVLPEMEVGGTTYHQSQALAIYLAKEHNLCGSSNLDLLRSLEVTGLVEDFILAQDKGGWYNEADPTKPDPARKVTPDLSKLLGHMEKLLKENGSKGYYLDSKVSVGDLSVYNVTDTLLKADPSALDGFPEIAKMRKNVEQVPAIKTYLQARPDTHI